MKNSFVIWMICLFILFFNACAVMPEGAKPITSFEKEKYLGQWFEIARLDFKFERDLNNTTANYYANDDGTIRVLNRGYNYKTKEWQEATGKAKFRDDPTIAKLKVSFFGPFYGSYNVIALDAEYKYALVCGKGLDYLWILSREKTIPDEIKTNYLKIASDLGYDVNKFIWVQHNP